MQLIFIPHCGCWWPGVSVTMVLSTYPCLSRALWDKCGPEIDTRRLSGDWQPGFGLLKCCCRLDKMADNLADDIFRCIFVNENIWMLNKISSKYVWECQIDNKSTLIRVTAWRRAGDKPLPEPMDALVSDIFRLPPVRISPVWERRELVLFVHRIPFFWTSSNITKCKWISMFLIYTLYVMS